MNLVQLNVAVTDHKGNYIGGLRPEDFQITEDKIPEKIATFEEGNGSVHAVSQGHEVQGSAGDASPGDSQPQGQQPAKPRPQE